MQISWGHVTLQDPQPITHDPHLPTLHSANDLNNHQIKRFNLNHSFPLPVWIPRSTGSGLPASGIPGDNFNMRNLGSFGLRYPTSGRPCKPRPEVDDPLPVAFRRTHLDSYRSRKTIHFRNPTQSPPHPPPAYTPVCVSV